MSIITLALRGKIRFLEGGGFSQVEFKPSLKSRSVDLFLLRQGGGRRAELPLPEHLFRVTNLNTRKRTVCT